MARNAHVFIYVGAVEKDEDGCPCCGRNVNQDQIHICTGLGGKLVMWRRM